VFINVHCPSQTNTNLKLETCPIRHRECQYLKLPNLNPLNHFCFLYFLLVVHMELQHYSLMFCLYDHFRWMLSGNTFLMFHLNNAVPFSTTVLPGLHNLLKPARQTKRKTESFTFSFFFSFFQYVILQQTCLHLRAHGHKSAWNREELISRLWFIHLPMGS